MAGKIMTGSDSSTSEALPGVSVIIPAHNRVELLERAIRSALAQAGVRVEIIVVDDGSWPPLADLMDSSLLARITLLRNDQCRNAAWSRNRGAAEASNQVLAFLDSDDYWRENHLAIALQELARFGRDVLFVAPFRRDDVCDNNGHAFPVADIYAFRFDHRKSLRTSGFVCPRELLDHSGGFDPDLRKHQDWDFALRLGRKNAVLYGPVTTVCIDDAAAERMSYSPNPQASGYFLEKHARYMSQRQLRAFIEHLIRSAVLSKDRPALEQIKAMTRRYIAFRSLSAKAKLFWWFPRLVQAQRALRGWFEARWANARRNHGTRSA